MRIHVGPGLLITVVWLASLGVWYLADARATLSWWETALLCVGVLFHAAFVSHLERREPSSTPPSSGS